MVRPKITIKAGCVKWILGMAETITKAYLDSPERDVLTPAGCKSLLGCGDKELKRLVERQEDPLPCRWVGNSRRFARVRVLQWLAEGDENQENPSPDS